MLPFVTTFAQYRPPVNNVFRRRWSGIYDHKLCSQSPSTRFIVFKNSKALKTYCWLNEDGLSLREMWIIKKSLHS